MSPAVMDESSLPPGYLVGMGVDFLEIARGDVQIRADFLHPLVDVLPAEREGIA